MVKMTKGLDLEAIQISKLNEYFLVADKIRKVGRNTCQKNDKLHRKLLNLNGGSGAPSSPIPKSSGSSDSTSNSDGPPP
jgi:hypothetical protein